MRVWWQYACDDSHRSGVKVRRAALWIPGMCIAGVVAGGAVASRVGAARRVWVGRGAIDASGAVARVDAMPLPGVMLWAWERRDELGAVRPGEAGVAYLAGTIFLREGDGDAARQGGAADFEFRPRLQPLRVAAGVVRMPVVRIETSRGSLAAAGADAVAGPAADASTSRLNGAQRMRVVDTLAQVASVSEPPIIQIDFDAAASERVFYESLLADVRARLGPTAHISITALASWCEGDAWLGRVPEGTIDEAVPMLFRMGPDASRVAATLADSGEFRAGVCRASAGISDDEPLSRSILSGRFATTPSWPQKRIYIFHNGNWNAATTLAVLGDLEKWHADFSASR
jgi:hypothetical protein